jgi:hypothetical protein
MATNSKFESRPGSLSCPAIDFYSFTTDIRNFEQFIPEGTIKNWHSSSDSCSFKVPPLGTATVRISKTIPYSVVVFSGNALQQNDFELVVNISENEKKLALVSLVLTAELNPVLKMMAKGPIERFLETLITEMEKFDNWKKAV